MFDVSSKIYESMLDIQISMMLVPCDALDWLVALQMVITFHLRYFAFQSTLPAEGPALGLRPLSTGLDRSLYSCLEKPGPGGTGDLP